MKPSQFIDFAAQEGGYPVISNWWYSRKWDDILSAQEIVTAFEKHRDDELINLISFSKDEMVKIFLESEGYAYLIGYMESVANSEYVTICVEFRRLLETMSDMHYEELKNRWWEYYRKTGTELILKWLKENDIPYDNED